MTERISMENDYTLKLEWSDEAHYQYGDGGPIKKESVLKRIFNFAAGQITTTSVERTFQSRNYNGSNGHSSITSQMHIEKFTDLASTIELQILHKKLTELGGHPPPLDDVLGGRSKQRLTVSNNKPG